MKHTERKLRQQYTMQFYRNNWFAFSLALLATVFISVVNLLSSWLMQQMIDTASGVEGALPFRTLFWLFLGELGAIVLFKLLALVSKPGFLRRAMTQYKCFAFGRLTQKSIFSFSQESTATYLSALTNDAVALETSYLETTFDLLFDLVLAGGSMVMMLWYSPLLTLVALSLFLLPIVASLLTGKRMTTAERQVSDRNEDFTAMLKDALTGFPVIKSFHAEASIQTQFDRSTGALEDAKCRRQKLAHVLGALGGVASLTAQFGTFLIGILLTGQGVTVGVLIIFMDLTGGVIRAINTLPQQLAARKAAVGLVDKLAASLQHSVRDEGEAVPAKLETGIELKQVSFGYKPEQTVLQDVSVRFEAGKRYAVVGASGSGKSTLLNLLMAGHSGYTGSITYDGRELRGIRSDSLYEVSTMIQQNVFLFKDTIENNITLYQPFPADDVAQAIRQSGLSDLIGERGPEALCGESGCNLSGGEQQRVSIARCLLRKSPVLLADEATAALDRETTCNVIGSILALEGLTRILVTHALDAGILQQFDEILVMKGGRLVEQGTFEELMASKQHFYALYTAQ